MGGVVEYQEEKETDVTTPCRSNMRAKQQQQVRRMSTSALIMVIEDDTFSSELTCY